LAQARAAQMQPKQLGELAHLDSIARPCAPRSLDVDRTSCSQTSDRNSS
jgi:hypothetical protein